MLILGIETATMVAGCALGDGDGVIAQAESKRGRRHAEHLAPQIEFVMHQGGVALSDVHLIAVDVGPGLFTGLRVGLATAKGLAFALDVPMIGISSLDLLAFPMAHAARPVVAAIDARRGEVYHATYRPVPGGMQREGDYAVSRPEELAADIVARGEPVLAIGDGIARYAELFATVDGVELDGPLDRHPSASALVDLAHPMAVREEFRRIDQVEPIYLRQPDAEINWVTRDQP